MVSCRLPHVVATAFALYLGPAPGAVSTAAAQTSPEVQLREGLYQEQTLRQPELAANTYRGLTEMAHAPTLIRAEAHLRLGICLERMGQVDQARREFERVVRQFADHPIIVEQARQCLNAISVADPATLMPPDSLLYVELLRPGRQVEGFLASLKDLDEAGLEVLLTRLLGEKGFRRLSNMLIDAVREDLTHIDSVAVGILAWEDAPYGIPNRFLVVIHPGKSIAARGFLAMLAQASGRPSGSYKDVKLWDIPDGQDGIITFANLPDRPGADAVMLAGKDRQVVCRAIDRHQAGAKASGLASQPEFRRQAGARRRESALLLYADVPRILDRFQAYLNSVGQEDYRVSRRLLALDTIERGMARVALLNDGALFELSLMFNDKPNPFYDMWRTPPADLSLLDVVPTDTAVAALMSVGEGRRKWEQIRAFFDQVGAVNQADTGSAERDPFRLFIQLEAMVGPTFAEDVISNCASVGIILPTLGPARTPMLPWPWDNAVAILRMTKPDEFSRLLERILSDHLRAGLDMTQTAGVQTWAYMHDSTGAERAFSVARLGAFHLLALNPDMLRHVLAAHRSGEVMGRSDLGRASVSAIPRTAGKVLLVRPELVGNGLRARQGLSMLNLKPVRPVVIYTIEQPTQAALRVEIGDLTDQLNNVILAAGARSPTSAPTIARPGPAASTSWASTSR